ncbi:MAG TPA: hypothetical protein VFV52_10655 [Bacilli bacterium]|nr:hypothetical protein [Bacilli bacterium]
MSLWTGLPALVGLALWILIFVVLVQTIRFIKDKTNNDRELLKKMDQLIQLKEQELKLKQANSSDQTE